MGDGQGEQTCKSSPQRWCHNLLDEGKTIGVPNYFFVSLTETTQSVVCANKNVGDAERSCQVVKLVWGRDSDVCAVKFRHRYIQDARS